ncbi:MlaD family protein [Thioclava electrotropha]|uniref:MlaD family protein n=1 Tax=Thioclava electrotropha TaxID=1549850 RepID=UPI0023A8A921|nr:MlaD family protein [Thioclava electrotropha]
MQESSGRDLAVGGFVLLGLLAIAYLSLQIGGLSVGREGGLVLVARFDDIGGLTARSPVRIAGVKVGRVERIDLDEDLRARVTLDVDPDRFVTISSSALKKRA